MRRGNSTREPRRKKKESLSEREREVKCEIQKKEKELGSVRAGKKVKNLKFKLENIR